MTSLKGQWTVTAGILPNTPEKNYTRHWVYTSDDMTSDMNGKKWNKMKEEAYNYAKEITDPTKVNWVAVDWVWL